VEREDSRDEPASTFWKSLFAVFYSLQVLRQVTVFTEFHDGAHQQLLQANVKTPDGTHTHKQ